jgi:hypothetical protein
MRILGSLVSKKTNKQLVEKLLRHPSRFATTIYLRSVELTYKKSLQCEF